MPNGVLHGKKVAATGRLASMTHVDLAQLVAAHGGEFLSIPNRSTAMLVIGQEGWPLQADGCQTVSLQRARRIGACGYPLEIVTEEDFLDRLDLTERKAAIRRRCTINHLSRMFAMPGRQIRAWVRAGLIEPVEVVHRLAYFEFREVASAKSLCDLTAAGVTTQRIRESLEQLRNRLPGIETPLNQLTVLEENGRLLVRLDDDTLSEPSGQLQFDFLLSPQDGPAVLSMNSMGADEWFEKAIAHEDRGEHLEAIAAYREAIHLEPDDTLLHFNLGNALSSLGRRDEAAQELQRAVACDPAHVEAWNNLGNVLADQGCHQEAQRAYGQALQLLPTYADAHYNLAELLSGLGRDREAKRHWDEYSRLDPSSPWREDLNRRPQLRNIIGEFGPAESKAT